MAKNDKELSLQDQKKEALKLTLAKLDKTYGKGIVRALGDNPIEDVEVYSSGSITLDAALGVGGYPKGRVIEIYGPESSGKTTLTLHAIAEVQKAGGTAAFIDAEHAFDPVYAKNVGVNTEDLLVSQPDSGEQALEVADALIRSNAVDLVIIDSVAALTPKTEIDGDMGDSKMGVHARLMSQALRKITGSISKAKCIVIFINQLRDKLGGGMYGGPTETTTGGNALKFYSSVRLEIRKDGGAQGSAAIKDGDGNIIGNKTKVKVVKNKVAPPFKMAYFDIMFGEGISKVSELLEMGVAAEIIGKSGAWFSYGDSKLAQGRDATLSLLRDNPELVEEIEAKVRQWLKDGGDPFAKPKKGKKGALAKSKKDDAEDIDEEDFDDDDILEEDDE